MVLVLGDAHASDPDNRAALLAAYDAADEPVALQVGDLEHYDLPVPTWFVAGNNEDFDVVEALRRGNDAGTRNAHLLASTTADVAGLTVGGLSGNFAPTQFEKSRSELAGQRRRHFVRADVASAEELGEVDVFLAHAAPHGLGVPGGMGREHVDAVLEAVEPALCLVGHYHRHAESEFGGTRVVSLAPAWEAYYTLDPESLSLRRHPAPGP